jgi:sec-independent protein translocase protein TatA
MFDIGTSEMIVFGIISVILFGGRLPSVVRSLGESIVEIKNGLRDLENEISKSRLRRIRSRDGLYLFRVHHRGTSMRKHWNKFLWSARFWAVLGIVGCVSGLYFQRVAANGSGLWCLGLIFLGAAYLEKRD